MITALHHVRILRPRDYGTFPDWFPPNQSIAPRLVGGGPLRTVRIVRAEYGVRSFRSQRLSEATRVLRQVAEFETCWTRRRVLIIN